jgi:serine/threonine protein phosphatase PrpC
MAQEVEPPDALADARCPSCGAQVSPADSFCETCGATLSPLAVAAVGDDPTGAPQPCVHCAGVVGDDGYCTTCGTKALTPRDHWDERPATWIAGVCDKGIVHTRNEDAMSLGTFGEEGAVIVVCDGVTSAPDSDQASLAAARIACASIIAAVTPRPAPAGAAATPGTPPAPVAVQRTPGDDVAFHRTLLQLAAAQANGAAVAVARKLGDPAEAPSCTFVAAVVIPADAESVDAKSATAAATIVAAWCGDSRAYWLPDSGGDVQLTIDHSLGTEMINAGRSREEAEADPTFHTITRWLGADSADPTAEIATCPVESDGWLLVCSDGLWNYASTPAAMRAAMVLAAGELPLAAADPLALADALVRFANEQGGHDNITAALARVTRRR